MATVKFTSLLQRFYPNLDTLELDGDTVHQIVFQLDTLHEGLTKYLLDDAGRVRTHVNIFVNGDMIKDREKLSDTVQPTDEIFILQALSGG